MTKYVRLDELDVLRGWAIVLMIVFHLCYDLNYFHYIDIDIYTGTFWHYFRNAIVCIFLLCMGISLSLAHTPNIQWGKLTKRMFWLGASSLLVSIVTYFVFPEAWVYFGILHFVVFATLVGLFLLPYPRISLLVAFLIFIVHTLEYTNMHWLWKIVNDNMVNLPVFTVDLVSFMPWFSFVLIGISMAYYGYHEKLLHTKFFKPSSRHNSALAYLGRHALIIYLVHQPIFFGFLMMVDM